MCENETLINLVRKCPVLYDLKYKAYKDHAKKTEIWESIATKLRLENGEVAKNKWRNLRDGYAKHLRTLNIYETETAEHLKKYKHWTWANHMEFLKPHVTTRQADYIPIDDHSDSNLDTRIKPEPTFEEEYVQYYEEPPNNEKSPVPVSGKQKSQPSPCSNIADEAFELLQTGKLQKSMDAIDLLFLSYAQTLKTFSPQRQVAMKLQIAQIISNAELKQLEEVDPLQISSS